MANPDLSGVTWRKSTRSGGGAGNCIEVAKATELAAVRDSKDPEGGVLAFERDAFGAFLSGIKSGRFEG